MFFEEKDISLPRHSGNMSCTHFAGYLAFKPLCISTQVRSLVGELRSLCHTGVAKKKKKKKGKKENNYLKSMRYSKARYFLFRMPV